MCHLQLRQSEDHERSSHGWLLLHKAAKELHPLAVLALSAEKSHLSQCSKATPLPCPLLQPTNQFLCLSCLSKCESKQHQVEVDHTPLRASQLGQGGV